MSIGGFSMLVDGYSKGLHDSIAYEDALDRTVHNQLLNNYEAASQPLKWQQLADQTDMGRLAFEYNSDQYDLYRMGYPGQMALQFMGAQLTPWLALNNYYNQFRQYGALMGMNPQSWLGMQGMAPSGV